MNKQAIELKDTTAEEKFAALQGVTHRAFAMTTEQSKAAKKTRSASKKRVKDESMDMDESK